MKDFFVQHLYKLAQDVAPVGRARIMAAVVFRNKIIAYGNNDYKTHPFARQYSKNGKTECWHAETKAIFNALRIIGPEKLSSCDLYVVRAKMDHNKQFMYGLAKPCRGCQSCIKMFNVRNVFYTENSYNGKYSIL